MASLIPERFSTSAADREPELLLEGGMRLVAVMVGGAAGALARWAIELAVPSVQGFPLAIFLINVTGAFALGLLGVLLWERLAPTRYLRPLLGIGFLGAYTTLSTMAMEGAQLLDQGQPWLAAGYRLVTLLGGQMAGVWGSGWDGYGQGTFSTFTFETLRLLEDGAWRYAAWNLLLSGPLSSTGALVTFLTVRWPRHG